MMPALQIRTVVSMPFEENTYLVWREGRDDALVVDPGLEPDAILAALQDMGRTPAAILCTHGHADHIAGNAALKEAFPDAPLVIGQGDAVMLADPYANLSAIFGMALTSPPADRTVAQGDVIEAAGIRLDVLFVPGHSPGHVALVCRDAPLQAFGGDVLFRGGIGRTDWPGGDHRVLLDSIRRRFFTLAPDTVVYPGHGPVTTIGHEMRTNPFVGNDER
jgi:glyoxylase-like metal-dependent hydrolase (beta-lactamase superfamily II)